VTQQPNIQTTITHLIAKALAAVQHLEPDISVTAGHGGRKAAVILHIMVVTVRARKQEMLLRARLVAVVGQRAQATQHICLQRVKSAMAPAKLPRAQASIVIMPTHARLVSVAQTSTGVVARLEVQAARPLVG